MKFKHHYKAIKVKPYTQQCQFLTASKIIGFQPIEKPVKIDQKYNIASISESM